jgi:quinolinate synthase
MNTIEKLYMCMVNKSPEIIVEETLRIGAKKSLDKMLEMSK